MLLTNELQHNETHPQYKKILLGTGILLVVIIGVVFVWYLQKNKIPDEKVLTASQKETLVTELNQIAKEAPLTDDERYQMVTGRTAQ
jgi:uncharacterized protein YpmB